ncbi:hypothetical protein HZB93_00085 [Candidatus Falkowbacteria bacterium]|nr:hypothetical protein [Candidatus Falkowbacteria bacterium]
MDDQKITGVENLIKQGIIYEDDFITLYMELIRDEGFMEIFSETDRKEVKKYLEILIAQSSGHKKVLENIINNLK